MRKEILNRTRKLRYKLIDKLAAGDVVLMGVKVTGQGTLFQAKEMPDGRGVFCKSCLFQNVPPTIEPWDGKLPSTWGYGA